MKLEDHPVLDKALGIPAAVVGTAVILVALLISWPINMIWLKMHPLPYVYCPMCGRQYRRKNALQRHTEDSPDCKGKLVDSWNP